MDKTIPKKKKPSIMLQEYEETLDIQERDLKLKWEQEDFQFPEV
jgi:hypothetical protein